MKKLLIPIILITLFLGAGCLVKQEQPEEVQVIDQEQQELVRVLTPVDGKKVGSPLELALSVKSGEIELISYEIRTGEDVVKSGVIQVPASEEAVQEVKTTIFLPVLEEDFTLQLTPQLNSGELEETIVLELKPESTEKTAVNVYFIDPSLQEFDCTEVDFEKRTVAKTERVAELALTELIEGPTADWAITSIPAGTKLESVTVEDGIATVEFSAPNTAAWSGGSCHVQSLRAQIERTLTQFSTVDEVIISVNGETEEILQP